MNGCSVLLPGHPVHQMGFGTMQLPGANRLLATPAQVVLAPLLAQAPTALLIPGTSSLAHVEQHLAAGEFVLDEAALSAFDQTAFS